MCADEFREQYVLGQQIGSGTFGVVYAPVALKQIEAPLEVQVLAKMKHHAITPIIDYFAPFPPHRKEAVIVFPERESDLHRFIERQKAVYRFGDASGAARGVFMSGEPLPHSGIDESVVRAWARQLLDGLNLATHIAGRGGAADDDDCEEYLPSTSGCGPSSTLGDDG